MLLAGVESCGGGARVGRAQHLRVFGWAGLRQQTRGLYMGMTRGVIVQHSWCRCEIVYLYHARAGGSSRSRRSFPQKPYGAFLCRFQ